MTCIGFWHRPTPGADHVHTTECGRTLSDCRFELLDLSTSAPMARHCRRCLTAFEQVAAVSLGAAEAGPNFNRVRLRSISTLHSDCGPFASVEKVQITPVLPTGWSVGQLYDLGSRDLASHLPQRILQNCRNLRRLVQMPTVKALINPMDKPFSQQAVPISISLAEALPLLLEARSKFCLKENLPFHRLQLSCDAWCRFPRSSDVR